ncbi:hypothetical protein N656DRAFT_321141 [Canariomyces notabilis]|uniref:MARVEL domain-containing protein n=1 Tax=Canariomyces notabilis TaxID=2074819 RepID=A0AAN6T9I4_9PEZI|nr:hypothetical protein N656DRAFT_321141 [Canariomyces arenarius]
MHTLSQSRSGPASDSGDTAGEIRELDEKHLPRSRDWSGIIMTTLRLFQLAYSAFAYSTLSGFGAPAYLHRRGSWQQHPDQEHHHSPQTMRAMRWFRIQALVILVYQTIAFLGAFLSRMLKSRRWPFARMATIFGDGCTVIAALNIMALLDSPHESQCHGFGQTTHFLAHSPTRHGGPEHVGTGRRRSVCRLMDAVVGLGVIFILSHLVSVIITIRRVSSLSQTGYAKVRNTEDVERGSARSPSRAAETSSQPMLQRQPTPPPPYRPVVPELAQDDLRGRSSIDTTLSVTPDVYLVSDGWRAPEEPPQYSSRPPSLHNILS